jgi:hypothetical protein
LAVSDWHSAAQQLVCDPPTPLDPLPGKAQVAATQ